MVSLITKLTEFVRSPRGRAVVEQARRQAAKPQDRRRLEQLRARFARRR